MSEDPRITRVNEAVFELAKAVLAGEIARETLATVVGGVVAVAEGVGATIPAIIAEAQATIADDNLRPVGGRPS